MAAGGMEHYRQLLWSHGWVIGKVFGGKASEAEIDSFIRYGAASSGAEPRNPHVDEKVAEILRIGKVVFD